MKHRRASINISKGLIFVMMMMIFLNPIYASDPIDTWELVLSASSQESDQIKDIAYGQNTYVAVGDGNNLFYSYDSNTWVSRDYGNSFHAISYGNGKFVAIGSHVVGISDSGVNWTINSTDDAASSFYNDIAYGNGIFVAVGSMYNQNNRTIGIYKTSSDGANWTTYTGDSNIPYEGFTKVEFINNEFVALVLDRPGMYTSGDGVNWTYHPINPQFNYGITSVAYGNGMYMAIIGEGTIMTSIDGVTWTDKGRIQSYFTKPIDLVYINGVFVVSGYGYNYGVTDYVYASVSGNEWIKGATISGADYTLNLSVANNTLFGTGAYLSIYKTGRLIPPTKPILVEAKAQAEQITLYWQDMSDNETSFKIFRSDGMFMDYKHINTVGSNQVSYTDTGLQTGNTYTYMIIASNNYGSSAYSNAISQTCQIVIDPNSGNPILYPIRLDTPDNLLAYTESSTSIRLSWEDASWNETGFMIERKTEYGTFQLINLLDLNQTSYIDTDLLPGTTYYYRIKAYNSTSESFYSYEAQARTDNRFMIEVPNQTLIPSPISLVVDPVDSFYDDLLFDDKGDISQWAREYVGEAYFAGIVNGYNNLFNPKDSLTLAKLVKMALAATNNSCDNGTVKWYDTWMEKATGFGIITSGDNLLAEADLSREQAAMLLVRTVEYINGYDVNVDVLAELDEINDLSDISEAYKIYVAKAYSLGIFGGDNNGNFNPDDLLNMEQSTKIILEMQSVLNMRESLTTE